MNSIWSKKGKSQNKQGGNRINNEHNNNNENSVDKNNENKEKDKDVIQLSHIDQPSTNNACSSHTHTADRHTHEYLVASILWISLMFSISVCLINMNQIETNIAKCQNN